MSHIIMPLIHGDERGTKIIYGTSERPMFELTITPDGEGQSIRSYLRNEEPTTANEIRWDATLDAIEMIIITAVAHDLPFTGHSFNHAVIEAIEQLSNNLTDE